MADIKSSLTKGLLAAVCSVLAMYAGVVSARHEARAEFQTIDSQAR